MTSLCVSIHRPAAALLRFAFAPGVAQVDAVSVACPRLAGPEIEHWSTAHDDAEVACVRIEVEDRDIENAAAQAYAALMRAVRPSAHPFLLRIWNYLDAINDGEADAERYRRFCVGRAASVDAQFHVPPPAATAIGHPRRTGTLQLVALCTRRPAMALENPRQTPAWQYPREFGPVAPGFSRGALLQGERGSLLLASGTASIVGHVSRHPGDPVAQLHESLANLEVLLEEGGRRGGAHFALNAHDAVRVYLRHPEHLPAVRDAIATRLPAERVLFLHGDICRRELLVELEGVFRPVAE